MNILFEIFEDMTRQGPGDIKNTLMALDFIQSYIKNPVILDIGCGTGTQTIDIAENIEGKIYALDLYQGFLDRLNNNITELGLEKKVSVVHGDMNHLDKYFENNSIDVIWAEGSVYNIGLEKALENWRNILNDNGLMVFSEISWINDNVPKEIEEYWDKNYSEMRSVDENINLIETSGYQVLNVFPITERSWTENYYAPLQERVNELKNKYANNDSKLNALSLIEEEIIMYDKFKEHYNYVFYIIRKNNK